MTIEAIIAVTKFTDNHENLSFNVLNIDVRIEPSLTPPNQKKSSSAYSLITSTISSNIITPIILSALSVTAKSTRAYC